ncbi:lipopolysaccharide biosynthesis protein [Oenococcus oeni]|uniref:lipopolysaccharide biosynthesis protein n=3 Tax=Oenococcus oeni TaxID=1247 RepID=UPI0008F96983|nr:hypothetical protein [Oenococcus oeni]OIM61826.1 hypothetical protein ATX87_09725 [Oenococcus oeni]
MSLADLGIGVALSYSLYKPMQEKNYPELSYLIRIYRKIYLTIGLSIFFLGVIVYPFLKGNVNYSGDNFGYYFYLYLLNSALAYFFTYNRSLLDADKKNYVISIYDTINSIFVSGMQLIAIYKNTYFLYLIFPILINLIFNIFLSVYVKKSYKKVFLTKPVLSDSQIITTLKRNTVGTALTKLSGVVVNGTDNIFISIFVSLDAVGVYSNYWMIIVSCQGFISQIFSSLTSTIGRRILVFSKEESKQMFYMFNFIGFFLSYSTGIIMFNAMNPFIQDWLGNNYVMEPLVSMVLVINYSIYVYRLPTDIFIAASGLSWNIRYRAIAEMIVNFCASIFLVVVMKFGLIGIVMSTFISTMTVISWWEPYILHKYFLGYPFKNYIKKTLEYCLVYFIGLICTYWVKMQSIFFAGWFGLIENIIITFVISFLIFLISFSRTDEFKQFILLFHKR